MQAFRFLIFSLVMLFLAGTAGAVFDEATSGKREAKAARLGEKNLELSEEEFLENGKFQIKVRIPNSQ
ncbi:hypothetical protein JTE90_011728 [Oedothorax gibbosus]|uniref:Uncharacterized protein n=1 Tax=Oedothorax gibbosus TaxID=931172 RepID=A0AAV6TUH5_9ARAC|nr:hypothetical protein JTE90_011728 [Oedothorax gibbosus]